MAVTGNTALVATKQDLIAALVQKELISKSVIAGSVTDVSRFAVKGAKSISFPKAGSFSVENRASGAVATVANLTYTADQLDLDFRANVSWIVDPNDAIESVIDVDTEYAIAAAKAHALYVDTQCIAVLEAAGDATATAGAISDAVILEMLATLTRRKADRSQLYLAISPEQESEMLSINKFVSVDFVNQVVPTGVMGTIYGIKVLITPELADGTYYMYEKGAVALGFQRAPVLDERKAPEYGAGAMLKILEQKFGVDALHLGQQGVGATESALIVKDGN